MIKEKNATLDTAGLADGDAAHTRYESAIVCVCAAGDLRDGSGGGGQRAATQTGTWVRHRWATVASVFYEKVCYRWLQFWLECKVSAWRFFLLRLQKKKKKKKMMQTHFWFEHKEAVWQFPSTMFTTHRYLERPNMKETETGRDNFQLLPSLSEMKSYYKDWIICTKNVTTSEQTQQAATLRFPRTILSWLFVSVIFQASCDISVSMHLPETRRHTSW